jgi:hypothetical protein
MMMMKMMMGKHLLSRAVDDLGTDKLKCIMSA